MRLSIIVPVLNEAKAIGPFLQAVRSQAPDAEIIVADGGSTDDTLALARAAGANICVDAPPSRGGQKREGAAAATGDVLLFLHVGTLPDGPFAESIASAISQGATWGCFRKRIDANGLRWRIVEWLDRMRVRIFRIALGDCALFARRQTLEAVGGFPPKPLFEDVAVSRLFWRQRFAPLAMPVVISTRHWLRRGMLRQTLFNWWLGIRFACGADPQHLWERYYARSPRRGQRADTGVGHSRTPGDPPPR